MCPPMAVSPPHIDFCCTDEELFLFLERIQNGYPIPENVITDINPYQYMPSNLPEDVWYFVRSKASTSINFGLWKTNGEECMLFSNPFFSGWSTMYEFYEGQAPDARKTDWMMQEYWISQKELCKNLEGSLCRVFLGDECKNNSEKQQKLYNAANIAVESHCHTHAKQLVIADADSNRTLCSSSKPRMGEDDETGELKVDQNLLDHIEADYLARGDFLELLDLDNPFSPSSCSENSSCLTMSSDECFDSLSLLQDIEREINKDLAQKNVDGMLCVSSSHQLTNVVLDPASSAVSGNVLEEKASNNTSQNRKRDYGYEGRSANSCNSASSSRSPASADGEKRVNTRRRKNLRKYFCFMPF